MCIRDRAGGSSNGLDAVYGWMYNDGFNSGNLDCEHRGAAGCWGHRKGILDDFGSGPNLAMGAAIAVNSDMHRLSLIHIFGTRRL